MYCYVMYFIHHVYCNILLQYIVKCYELYAWGSDGGLTVWARGKTTVAEVETINADSSDHLDNLKQYRYTAHKYTNIQIQIPFGQ